MLLNCQEDRMLPVDTAASKSSATSNVIYQDLRELCKNNASFFESDDSESGQRLYAGFLAIADHVDVVCPLVDKVRVIVAKYDFNSSSPGNGYRSFVIIVDAYVTHCVKLNKEVNAGRNSLLFRKNSYVREVEVFGQVLASLGTIARHVHTLLSWCAPGELFPDDKHSPEELLRQAENINLYCFYGRCLGMQYCDSMRQCLKFISICMASFSEIYYGNGGILLKAASSLWTGGRYVMDPDLRARRIVNISQNASVDFCKSFWLLAETELMGRLPGVVGPSVAVNQVMYLPPEPMSVGGVAVPVPKSHLGPRPLPVRLLLARKRTGMVGSGTGGAPPSKHLIVHLHGGGFVAQSSRSHEMYLREWVVHLDAPLLSVDYSLAPAAPFPRALEEALYAYCWSRTHLRMLGADEGAHIIMAGDSAGGNLCLGVTLRCLELGIPPPAGLFLAYVPVLVSFVPSPSRLLCLVDPLLPFGFMMRCLKAYTCGDDDAGLSNGGSEEDSESACNDPSDLATRESAGSVSGEETDTLTAESLGPLQSEIQPTPTESSRYVSEFLERYVNSDVTLVTADARTHHSEQQEPFPLPNSKEKPQPKPKPSSALLDLMMQRSPSAELCFTVPPNPLLSPYIADDSVLQRFPPVSILSVEMDPCLDDCVMFARKLQHLSVPVTLDVLPGLPHGFLNFVHLSKEARSGSLLCIQRIQQLFDKCS